MCSHLTLIGYTSTGRTIAQCEHGTCHLTWDMVTVRLRKQDFLTLARFLVSPEVRNSAPLVADGWCQLARDQHGAARLWIAQVGVVVAARDVQAFFELIDEAAGLLAQPPSAAQSVWQCPVLTADVGALGYN